MIGNHKGVTLTEVVVTTVIIGILAGGIMAILMLNATETGEGIVNARMQTQYDNIVEQVSRAARFSAFALNADAGETVTSADSLAANNSVTHIILYDWNGNDLAGYQISAGALLERDTATGSYHPYKCGSTTVSLTPGSHFRLPAGRRGLELRLRVTYTYKTITDSLTANALFISCRN